MARIAMATLELGNQCQQLLRILFHYLSVHFLVIETNANFFVHAFLLFPHLCFFPLQ